MKRWERRIAEAKRRGRFTEEDRALAAKWVTCACGEQDSRIPRRPDSDSPLGGPYEPKDARLRALGNEFYLAVDIDDFRTAGAVLEKIELRAFQVLYLPDELLEVVQEILDQQPPIQRDPADGGVVRAAAWSTRS